MSSEDLVSAPPLDVLASLLIQPLRLSGMSRNIASVFGWMHCSSVPAGERGECG